MVGISFTLTYSTFNWGSKDPPCHSAPPKWLGMVMVPRRLGGVKIEPERYFLNSCKAYSWASGVIFVRSASVTASRARGGGLMGSNCVGHVSSPGTSERGV